MDLRQLAKAAAGKLHLLTEEEKRLLLKEIEELEAEDAKAHAQGDFMGFVKRMWPGFIPGRHHEVVAKAFEDVVNGHNKRLIINMAPRHTKSEFASYLLPAWFLGKNPQKKVIQTSHTAELAVGFGRKVRNLIDSEEYHAVFDDVKLKADNKSAGRWATNKGGEYFSIGVGGSVTGKGADLLIIDDPHSEQEAKLAAHKPDVFDAVYEWYTSGPRQRLQPGGAIIIVMTRWSLHTLLPSTKIRSHPCHVRTGNLPPTVSNKTMTPKMMTAQLGPVLMASGLFSRFTTTPLQLSPT